MEQLSPELQQIWDELKKLKRPQAQQAAITYEAQLAGAILEKWALVAGIPDGEDSAGRQQVRLPLPIELVARACEIAGSAVKQFRERGWIQEAQGNPKE